MSVISNNVRRLKDFWKYIKLFGYRDSMYYVTNENIRARIRRENAYQKMEAQFADRIRCGVESGAVMERSNKVWICWFQGEETAPALVKACIASVRKNLSDREVITLTEETISEYIQIPEYIISKWKRKEIGAAHFSDILRVALLCKYGGIWIDATVLCTSSDIPKAIAESPLFVYKAMDLIRLDREPVVASSWLISAWSNHPILMLTRDLLYEYWKTADKIDNYFLFHIFFALATKRYDQEWNNVPMMNNHSPHTLQFELEKVYDEERWNDILKMSVFHKLNWHVPYLETENTFYHYILKNFLP